MSDSLISPTIYSESAKADSLYIHIPFCKRKCGYCDFPSLAGKEGLISEYLDALNAETAANAGKVAKLKTLYVGGGTPSLLNIEQLKKLFKIIGRNFGPLPEIAESTFEANPESFNTEKAFLLKTAGFNRLSLGLQTTQNRLLKSIGRLASFEVFLQAYANARQAGFENINIDLMSGLPEQSNEDFLSSLTEVISLNPEHISFYALEVHPGTPFAGQGRKEAPDASATMFEQAQPALAKAGYIHYEISNFAKPGKESRHNINYWRQGNYLGLGASAASHFKGRRFANTPDPEKYIKTTLSEEGTALAYEETLTASEQESEKIMLGLRLTAGIELEDDIIIKLKDRIENLAERGLLVFDGHRVKIKKEALYLANAVFRELI